MANGISNTGQRIKRVTGQLVASTGGLYLGTRVIPVADYDFTTGLPVDATSGTANGITTDGRRIQAVAFTEGAGRYYEKYAWGTGALSGATAIALNTALPVISGIQTSGQTLSATNGTWDQPYTSAAYQWNRSGVDILGATSSTYLQAIDDVAETITVEVVVTNSFGDSDPAESLPTDPIAAQLTLSGTADTTATVSSAYSWTPTTSGGRAPYAYSSAAMPSGWSLNAATGAVTATPSTVGSVAIPSITVTDADGLTATFAGWTVTISEAGAGAGQPIGLTLIFTKAA